MDDLQSVSIKSEEPPTFLKTDDNKVINTNYIRWIAKFSECVDVCIKSDGCFITDTHRICKLNNPDSYEILNKFFK
jgi:hypothetical protein